MELARDAAFYTNHDAHHDLREFIVSIDPKPDDRTEAMF